MTIHASDLRHGSRIVGSVEAAFTDSGYTIGREFQSSDGYWYRVISQSASHAAGTVLQFVPATTGGYACETGYASTVKCKPAGVVVTGYTAVGIQPVLIKGRHSAIKWTAAASSSASETFGYASDGTAIAYTTAYRAIGFTLASAASTLTTLDAWVDIY